MPAAGLLIASGADRGYFPLLRDTVLSIRAQHRDAAIGILDCGFAPEHREWLARRVTHLVQPEWDFDFPGRERTPKCARPCFRGRFCAAIFPVTTHICGSTRMHGSRTGVLSSCTSPQRDATSWRSPGDRSRL